MLAVLTLWRREVVRLLRQRSRVVGALGQPVVFWLLLGGGLSASFRPPGAPVAMGRLGANRLEKQGLEHAVEKRDPPHAHRPDGVPVVGEVQREEARFFGARGISLALVLKGDLEGDLDSGRPAVRVKNAREALRRDGGEFFRQLDRGRMPHPQLGGVRDAVELRPDGGVDLRAAVSVQVHPERGYPVEEAVPLDIDQVGALATLDDDGGFFFFPIVHRGEGMPEMTAVELEQALVAAALIPERALFHVLRAARPG